MENAADALKMAGWVLIFVVALSICINAFTQARGAMDTIMTYSDRQSEAITDYIKADDVSDDLGHLITRRTVSRETIVPTMYRVFKENFRMKFPFPIYKKYNVETGNYDEIDYIDFATANINDSLIPAAGSDDELRDTLREYFIRKILYGNNALDIEWCDRQLRSQRLDFYPEGIIDKLNSEFYEELGVYYQEEYEGKTDVPDANKVEKRVITYTYKT